MDVLPGTGEAVLLTLDRALDGCPWDPSWLRPLGEAIVDVADRMGDEERAKAARKLLETIDREEASEEHQPFLLTAATQILTALWCLTHDGFVLEGEQILESAIEPSRVTWRGVISAIHEERIEDIPVPHKFVRVWGAPEEIDEEAIRYCLEASAGELPAVARAIECLWGGALGNGVPDEVARQVVKVAVIRRLQIERDFRPLPGERRNIWYEAHQGARRPETLERIAVLVRMHEVLLRAEIDPMAVVATVHLGRAAETESRSKHNETEKHLAEAMRWTRRIENDPSRRDYGAVCVAQSPWYRGEFEEAIRRLRGLEGERASAALREIEENEEGRATLRSAEEEHALRGNVESWCGVAVAHVGAGHTVRAELVAPEICERHPEIGIARCTQPPFYRNSGGSATPPCLPEGPSRSVPTRPGDARFSRGSSDGSVPRAGRRARRSRRRSSVRRPRGRALARCSPTLPTSRTTGADIRHARQADDLLWERRFAEQPPAEWLGAAAARRCHEVWAEDAPEWLARLAGAAPQELARFVVERIEALLYWHAITEPSPQGGIDPAGDEGFPGWMGEAAKELAHRTAREKAVGAALRAAFKLGYVGPDLDDGHGRTGTTIVSARAWDPHVAEIASCFGDELAIRLRASESAQPVLFGSREAGAQEYLVVRETLAGERLAWKRWGETNEVFPALDAISELSPATRARLGDGDRAGSD